MSTLENNLEYEDYSIMCYLPDEILSRIFAILRAEDRKSVRLVCSSWYQCSTRVSITKNEKFVFRPTVCSIEDVTKVMLESNYSNLEFQDQSIDGLPASIWEECGHQIRSLKFFHCRVDAETIRNIVIHCENLISFTFENRDTELGKKIFCSPQLFDELAEKGIQRKKLRTFVMLIRDPLGEIVLNKLFLVYPCVTHFVAETLSHYWFSYFPNSLESLEFRTPPYKPKLWMKACTTKSEQGLRLRRINGVFYDMDESYVSESLLNFLLSQKDLNSVTLKLEADVEEIHCHQVFKNITFQILERCPSLQEFRIELNPIPYFELEELSLLHALISKLRCLSLCFHVSDSSSSIFLHQTSRSLLFPAKLLTHLTTLELRLEYCKIKDDLYAMFFENCPSLLHLSVADSLSDHALQLLFKNLLKLQTLFLWAGDNLTDYGFIGHNASSEGGYSIRRLQQLKRLHIEDLKQMQGVKEIVLEFHFPHLEYLFIDVEVIEMLSEEELIRFSGQIPNLKQLEILIHHDKAWSKKAIVNVCKYLRNIHGLLLFCDDQRDEFKDFVMEYSEEFFSCPSLRFVSNLEYSTFFFDVLTHTVVESERVKFETYDDIFMYL